jgi:AAA+ ATPase superfamily predicted ATPase
VENPFKYGGIVRGPHFADRTEELAELVGEMKNLTRVFLISPRRFGKTCLLFNLMDKLRSLGLATAYLDLNAYPDVRSFAAALTLLTSKALESNAERLLRIFSQLQRLRPKVSVGHDGSITASVEVAAEVKEALPALQEGMRHAETLAREKGKKLVLIIDEFSDLPKYDGQTLEKALRAELQQHDHVGYIFSGSEQSVMLSMIRDRKRAFYKLGRIMALRAIDRQCYADFIHGWLKKGAYKVERDHLEKIFELGRDVPYNIQRLCHTMWELARETREINPSLIEELPVVIAQQDSPHFELVWQAASQQQRTLLIALSREPDAKPFSREFQLTHGIGPSSSIKASLDSLTKKGILFKPLDGSYQFSDIFMAYWISYLKREEN